MTENPPPPEEPPPPATPPPPPAEEDENAEVTAVTQDLRDRVKEANAISVIGLELKGGGRW